jgi:hypothetical protein
MISFILRPKIWLGVAALLLIFVAKGVFAMESSASAIKKYNLIFPVAELGNCGSLTECKNFCEDLSNISACINFAKQKGFYKAPPSPPSEATLLEVAKQELGCDSKEACQQFCGLQENWLKCGEFAKKHKLGKPPEKSEASSSAVLEKAKQFLGCGSLDQCKSFCSKVENRTKCDEFAKVMSTLKRAIPSLPLKPGEGRGGENINIDTKLCGSLEACKEYYCSRNPELCRQIEQKIQSTIIQKYLATQSAEVKKLYCQKFPQNCGGLKIDPTNASYSAEYYQKATACIKTSGCTWLGNNGGCSCKDSQATTQPGTLTTPSVQGISKEPNFFQRLLQALLPH